MEKFLCVKKFCESNEINMMTKILHIAITFFSQLYRCFRVYNDRSLVEWGKSERERKERKYDS